jgi:hypothetical protein
MSVNYSELQSCDDIDQSLFEKENWYLMAWGMGDALNAVLFLESQSLTPYKILCPPRNLSAIKFILDNFADKNPKCQEVVVYPLQFGYPIPEDDVVMSKHGFAPHTIHLAEQIPRLKVVHAPPRDWFFYQRLETCGIYQRILQYEKDNKSIENKTCVLFPERGDSYQFPDNFWNEIIKKMNQKGYEVYVNTTKKSDVYLNEKLFENTKNLDKPDIKDLFDSVVKHKNLVTIGQRSGIFDFLKYFECLKIIFYYDIEDPNMEDPSRALYEWSHFENDLYTKNSLELKLSQYNPIALDLIIP